MRKGGESERARDERGGCEGGEGDGQTAKGCHQMQQASERWKLRLEDVLMEVCQPDW